jgi:hypothetical protein
MLTQRASGQARAKRTSADHPEFTGPGLGKNRTAPAQAEQLEPPRQGGIGIAHGSIQAVASWSKPNGLVNVLDGAGTHPSITVAFSEGF